MHKTGFEKILDQLAQANHTTPNSVRKQLKLAMDAALNDADPQIQAMWKSIPKKGSTVTLEEFMEYLIEKKQLLP